MKYFGLSLVLLLGTTNCLYANDFLKGINTGPDTMVRIPKPNKKAAQIRIGIKITPYNKVVVTDSDGVNQVRYVKGNEIQRNLRSRVNKKTHFYFEDWHIELEPIWWKKESMTLAYEATLYRQFGVTKNVEEKIGSIEVKGTIEGSKFIYQFNGSSHIKFKNKSGKPIVEMALGNPIDFKQKLNVAKSKSVTIE